MSFVVCLFGNYFHLLLTEFIAIHYTQHDQNSRHMVFNCHWLKHVLGITRFVENQAISLMIRVFAYGPGGWGFNPRLSHTKDLKNGTWCCLA